MIFQLYGLTALMVLALAIGPFLNDPQAKTRPGMWLFLALAMALGPITLPSMLRQRLRPRSPRRVRTIQYS
ncbi:hypothetical protein [Nodosilinea sp. P-1105]|uniref:hypothetical protein n=1 Tax=Nodosilinea sp. P-1105 TaxID=2546229 RepID=UPI001469F5A2|nr:hypothetical protein [Nodosilinea sp. P-1105]NMF86046.1 hypothetical protein [Nodosilinea sp. P-1105]